MTMYNINAYVISLILLINVGCGKEGVECNDCLGTFRCEINGEEWKPHCSSDGNIVAGWCRNTRVFYYEDTKGLEFWVKNEKGNNRLSFLARGLGLGDDEQTTNLHNLGREYIDFSRGNCGGYGFISSLDNRVDLIKLDTANSVIEGTFFFSVLGECDMDTLHITNGYFHLSY